MAMRVQQTRVSASWGSGRGCLKGLPTFVEDMVLRKDKDCLLRRDWGSHLSAAGVVGAPGLLAAGPQGAEMLVEPERRGQWGLLILPICGTGARRQRHEPPALREVGVGGGGHHGCQDFHGRGINGPGNQEEWQGLQRRQVEKMG